MYIDPTVPWNHKTIDCLAECHAPEPKSEARQTPCTREWVPQMHKTRNLSNSHLIPQKSKDQIYNFSGIIKSPITI
ncbi:hypothetical protein SLEP1_g25236 [Rubroshorea leprosula]|uniref:Uncharacterized protein n=1 Tax=Rubroshorea leprosula TaxID=152421 RepID=A0AAV5JUB3_9ROSI|nr:hypothetical protein SLEP1_g25236 [Rubroshorea leprosula]